MRIVNLPVELIEEILSTTLNTARAKNPIYKVGHNAAWTMPSFRAPSAAAIKSPGSHDLIGTIFPFSDESSEVQNASVEEEDDFPTISRSLRLVSRTFNEIVTPFLYRDVNLLVQLDDAKKFEKIINISFLPHVHHIQSILVYADHPMESISSQLQQITAEFLHKCTNLTSLGLYSHDPTYPNNWTSLPQVVCTMVEERELTSLGFYSQQVLTDSVSGALYIGVRRVIDALARSEQARHRVQHLDIAVSRISAHTSNQIHSNFPNLESLTMRKSIPFNPNPSSYAEPSCKPSNTLTKLQFYACQWLHVYDIPEFVSIFPALRELLVSNCCEQGEIPPPHAEGWHVSPDALCNTHQPLDWLHIEHMNQRRIRMLGLIPTKTLILTSIKPQDFLKAMKGDKNLFPGVTLLRLKAIATKYGRPGPSEEKNTDRLLLEEICRVRNITIARDAQPIFVCTCCRPMDL
ncbi:hypothetical protein CPB86DRAFT_787263 [Serendipita vermifera]|nr:hypothetical protein CPB86DRAFT_787263 [Serendipita vermifera]